MAQRARDTMAFLYMANRVSRERYDDDEESPFYVPTLPDEPEQDWLTTPGSTLTATEQLFAEETRFYEVRNLQDALLGRTDALLMSALSMYLDRLSKDNQPERLADHLRRGG